MNAAVLPAAVPALTFDADSHTYRVGGRRLTNVTEVLNYFDTDLQRVPEHALMAGALRGKYVHDATEMDDQGRLNTSTLDEALAPYVMAWRKFKADTGFVVEASEQRVYHPRWEYAGTLDCLGRAPRLFRGLGLIDKKSGVISPFAQLQTGAYAEAAAASGQGPIEWRAAVYLRGDGTYVLEPHRDPSDRATFLNFLSTFRWLQRAGIINVRS